MPLSCSANEFVDVSMFPHVSVNNDIFVTADLNLLLQPEGAAIGNYLIQYALALVKLLIFWLLHRV